MAKERMREELSLMPAPEHFRRRAEDGWRLVAIEWERERPGESGERTPVRHPLPYGLRISADCRHLEDDPVEREALTLMLALIVDDRKLSQVAEGLNRQGFRQRSGSEWTQRAVFDLLPRLIEFAPQVMSVHEWAAARQRLLRVV
jgi:hypothetical protein